MTLRAALSRSLVLALAALLAACGDDGTGPDRADVTGRWTYNASNVSGSGVACDLTGLSLDLDQEVTTFSGTTTGGALSCRSGGDTYSEPLGSGVVANGIVDGNAIEFDLGTSDIHHTGSVAGSSMSGVVTIRLDVGGSTGEVVLAGNWSAVRR